MTLLCPPCRSPLEVLARDGESFHHCAACGGVLLSSEQLAQRLPTERVQTLFAEVATTPAAGCACPGCGGTCVELGLRGTYRSVPVDVCGACRWVWFDAGELYDLGDARRTARARRIDDGQPVLEAASSPPARDWIDHCADVTAHLLSALFVTLLGQPPTDRDPF